MHVTKRRTEASVCHYAGWVMNSMTGAVLMRGPNMQTFRLSNSLSLHNVRCCNTSCQRESKFTCLWKNGTHELNKQEGLEIRLGFDCNEAMMSREGYCFGEIMTCFEPFGRATPQDAILHSFWRVILIADRFPLMKTCFVFISLGWRTNIGVDLKI